MKSALFFSAVATLAWSIPQPTLAREPVCTGTQITTCASYGGELTITPSGCLCRVGSGDWIPRRVINARDGDVGIVPLDGRGDATVAAITSAIGQFHRHAVMFHDEGRQTRHNTMILDPVSAVTIPTQLGIPDLDGVRLRQEVLENGLPGAITQSIDETVDLGRLSNQGLLLKPALSVEWANGVWVAYEPNRPRFEAAVASAQTQPGYYKLSDYTNQDSMSLPVNDVPEGDEGGSHCSGYASEFYRDQGLQLDLVSYPESLRRDVAQELFTRVRSECTTLLAAPAMLSGLANSACRNIANQVTNCFADLGCGDTSNTWTDGVGNGNATSPDNMIPTEFRYSGTADYQWGDTTLEGNNAVNAGVQTEHPGDGSLTVSTTRSPFERVEAQQMVGGYYDLHYIEIL